MKSKIHKIPEMLLRLRKKSGLTQQKIADALGFSKKTYSKYERGECEPSADKLIVIADHYDISLDTLIKGIGDDPILSNYITPKKTNEIGS